MLLQIMTAKPAIGLTRYVENAIEEGHFAEILDRKVKYWPVKEVLSLAKLALNCCELRRKDRPDLDFVILPELERLKELGSEGKDENRFYYMYSQDKKVCTNLTFKPCFSEGIWRYRFSTIKDFNKKTHLQVRPARILYQM